MILLFYLPTVCGLAIVAKTNFEEVKSTLKFPDNGQAENKEDAFYTYGSKTTKNETDEDFFPVIPDLSDRKEATNTPFFVKKETSKKRKAKLTTTTEKLVPIIRGGLSKEDLSIDGLEPPSAATANDWYILGGLESSTRYPDSNGHYPDVGGYPPASTPRPVYGVPPNTYPSWCPTGGSNSGQDGYPPTQWGMYPPSQGQNPNWGQYPPTQGGGQYPPTQGGGQYPPTQGGGRYPPSQGGGQYPPGQGSGQYPPGQGGGQYPPNGGGQWGSGQYPPTQGGGGGQYPPNGGQWGSGQYPPMQGGSWGQNQYPNYQGSGQWSGGNLGSRGNRPWSWSRSPSQSGGWQPCRPYDLSNPNSQSGSGGCPDKDSSASNRKDVAFVPPLAPPTSKVNDKILYKNVPRDVEEISP